MALGSWIDPVKLDIAPIWGTPNKLRYKMRPRRPLETEEEENVVKIGPILRCVAGPLCPTSKMINDAKINHCQAI